MTKRGRRPRDRGVHGQLGSCPAVGAPWRYDGTLPLVRTQDTWSVQWGPADLHPKLTAAGLASLKVEHVLPERAALQDAAGQPLFAKTDVVTVGVQPSKVTDLPRLATALAARARDRRGRHRRRREDGLAERVRRR